MRKVILIALVVFIAVVAGGYSMLWFSQASQIKHGIENAIAKANAQQKYLTYDSIETSGFPSDINVTIVRPHFTGRIDTLLKTFEAKMHPAQPDEVATMPEWNEDVVLNGHITIGINALSDRYSLHSSGNWQRNSDIGGQKASLTTQSSGDSVCTLQMAHSGGLLGSMWDYHALARDNGKDFVNDLRLFDCSGPANTISDATSHEKLLSNGPWRFYVSSKPQGAEHQARIYLNMTDLEVTPQGDAMMLLQHTAVTPGYSSPVKYSLFGKQNVEVDLSYIGPADWQAAGKNPPLDIKLSKFTVTNAAYTGNATFFLSNGMSGAERAARLAFKAETNYGEQYDAILQDMAHSFIAQIYAGKTPQLALLQPYTQKYTPDELYAIIAPAIPNLHSLGKMVQALDISYVGAPDFATGNVTLADLELSASPYGIKGSGSVKRAEGLPVPQGQAMLVCSNCTRLVDDITDYAARLQKAMSYFEPPEQTATATPIDAKLADGIKRFLKALAAPTKDSDPDKATFTYAIVSDGTMGIMINDKHMNDILAMYNEYIGTVLKAGTPAPGAAPVSPLAPAAAPVPAESPAPANLPPVSAAPAAPAAIPAPASPLAPAAR